MKQLTQNIRKKTLTVEEVPVPACKAGGVLVRTIYSAVSVGTEVMKMKNADLNYLQMARKKPEQVREVVNNLKQQGPVATYRKVMNKLDSLSPLGYSLVGEVIETGNAVNILKKGDIVACAGAGYANHAEVNYVPVNLCARVPAGVDPRSASFATIASIAMQGFRQTQSQIGENVAVVGLGLLGQILVQIIQANGCRAFGFDISPDKCETAMKNGAYYTAVADKTDFDQEIGSLTNGFGCDSVIITTGTSSNDPVILAGRIARDKAKIVDIGITKMDLPWDLYYHKELDFRFSRSYGPGRYDPSYEENGVDYPIGHVRWTEQRNMMSVLQLLKDGKINFENLITHEFDFADAGDVFPKIKEGKEDYLGVVMRYGDKPDISTNTIDRKKYRDEEAKTLKAGLIGAGNYASTMLLPFLDKKATLVGIATSTGVTAHDKAGKFGFSYETTDYKKLIADDKINTLVIATRHNQHASMVSEGLEAGKNVYVEKPLAISLAELKTVTEKYKNSDGLLMVGYNRRYSPSIRYLKKQLNKDIAYSVYYQVNAGYIPPDNWYQSPHQGGRIIGEVCHFIDTLQYLLDAEPTEVYASSGTVAGMPEQDNSHITIKFSNGSSCVIAYLADGDKGYPKEKILITGYRTNIEFDNFKSVRVYKDGRMRKKKFISADKGQKEEMSALVNAVEHNTMPVKFESLILNTYTTIRALDSIRSGEAYQISQERII